MLSWHGSAAVPQSRQGPSPRTWLSALLFLLMSAQVANAGKWTAHLDNYSCPVAAELLGRLSASLTSKMEDRDKLHCLGENSTNLTDIGKLDCLIEALSPHKSDAKVYRAGERGGTTGYGELDTAGAFDMLAGVNKFGLPLGSVDKFTDLGSGRGHTVVQLYLCTDVKESFGVELVQERHEVAEYVRNKLAKELKNSPEIAASATGRELVVHQGSLIDEASKWADSTVVLANSLLFDDDTMFKMRALMLKNLPPGTIILSSKTMNGCRNDVIRRFGSVKAFSSWNQEARLHVYVRWPKEKELDAFGAKHSVEECLKHFNQLPAHLGQRLCESIKQVETGTTGVHAEIEELHGMDGRCAWNEWQFLQKMPESIRDMEAGGLSSFLNDVDWKAARDKDSGRTVIHHAAMGSDTDHIEELIKVGADINAKSGTQQTPLHLAKSRAMVKTILAAGGDLEAVDKFKRTPLLHSLEKGPIDVVEALLEAGASIKAKDGSGHTSLHILARRKGAEGLHLVQKLLEGDVDVLGVDVYGRTAEADCQNAEVKEVIHKAVKAAQRSDL
mmetsp:Transcript_47923/g.111806  ORF Transcript_47923/g.111806 Transcript_47923/m.111806 type:complete len:558 (-) Transcript_47923:91-1764(-)